MSNLLRIPNLKDYRNEVVSWIGIAMAVLTCLADLLGQVDLQSSETAMASLLALLLTNFASTQVVPIFASTQAGPAPK
jgi:hypothetical protein